MGLEAADDAGVMRLTDEIALVQTVDFFTPIVDDPYTFGRIAAANALSDIYAMGAVPLSALNLVAFPRDTLEMSVLREVLRGGLDTLREADAVLVGGHSIADPEFKYGLAVTGTVHPDRVLTNRGCRPGDRLVLTKPLGTGIVSTAHKRGKASVEAVQRVERSMCSLNRRAAELIAAAEPTACTDITGFGLVIHAAEMLEGGDAGIVLDAARVPAFPDALEYAAAGLKPGGLKRNRQHGEAMIELDSAVPEAMVDLLFDPQTSGGLLAAVPAGNADDLLRSLTAAGVVESAVVGQVVDQGEKRITIR